MKSMKKKGDNLVIGFDMDGVIIDHTKAKLSIAKKLGIRLTPKQTQSDIIETVVSGEVMDKIRDRLYHFPELTGQAKVMAGALGALQLLKNAGHSIFLISRRSDPELARALLKERGLWPGYFDESNSFFVASAQEKNTQAAALGVDIYMDDQPSVLSKLVNVPKRCLFDRFGNFGVLSFVDVNVSSWPDFLSHIL
jgi:hypothetical protein